MSRRDARRHAFHLVFQFPFYRSMDVETLAESKLWYYEGLTGDASGLEKLKRPTGRDAEYVDRAAWGVLEKKEELDSVIEKFLRGWELDRISKVDLALMRLSIYEMLCESDVPLGAAVNEAVELAKEYGSDESPAFVNGVLGNIARAIGNDRKTPLKMASKT